MITGDREHGVSRFQLCSNDGTICYTIRYYYGNTHRYPERITVNRDHGSERLSLEINDVHVKGGSSSTNGEDSVERATHGELLRFGGVSL